MNNGKEEGGKSAPDGDPGSLMAVGPHVSAAGGVANSIENGERVGASCIQIFTRNQRSWKSKPLSGEEVESFRSAWEGSSIGWVMSHDSYLINLGSPDEEKLALSRQAFTDEARRCALLGIRLLNFHPGAHMGEGEQPCLERIARSVLATMEEFTEGEVLFTIENTAGQGTAVGHRLEHLEALLEMIGDPERTGVCLDTCHLFAAGYNLADDEGWGSFWEEFERRIGLKLLRAMHLNDAKKPLGSRVDRHENLGEGAMGGAVFKKIAQDPRLNDVPMFLETPGGEEVWQREIAMMRGYRREAVGARRSPVIHGHGH